MSDLWVSMALPGVVLLFSSLLFVHYAWQRQLIGREKIRRMECASYRALPTRISVDFFLPSVDIIVPCYDEDPSLLGACCDALDRQTYSGRLRVYLVDDGSSNLGALESVYGMYDGRDNWTVLRLGRNVGKRRAQDAAMHFGLGEIVVNVDSDTLVDPKAIELLITRFKDPRVGMVAGQVLVLNRDENSLTRLIGTRYLLLFDQERTAQCLHVSVLCCAGAFAAYRRSELDGVWLEYLTQRFAGVSCTSGEDLHLSLLLLAGPTHSVYEPEAIAKTMVPTTLRRYLRQQLRWARSFYRELRWMGPVLKRRPAFMTVDVASRTLLPLLLPIAVATVVSDFVIAGASSLLRDSLLIAAICLMQVSTVLLQSKKLSFLPYGLLYAGLLVPMRLYALATMDKEVWEARGPAAVRSHRRSRPRLLRLARASGGPVVASQRSQLS